MKAWGPIGGFLLRFTLGFGLLAIPWRGWDAAYGAYFRGLGRVFFHDNARRELSLAAHPEAGRGGTRIVIVNRALLAPDGSGPVRQVDFGAWRLGWMPTALFIALTLSVPLGWRRRFQALLCGLLTVHAYLLAVLAFFIWHESAAISLVDLPAWGRVITAEVAGLLRSEIALAAPVLIWLLVTFRRDDWHLLEDRFLPDRGTGFQ